MSQEGSSGAKLDPIMSKTSAANTQWSCLMCVRNLPSFQTVTSSAERPCPCGSWKKFLGHETPRAQPVSEQTVVYVPVHGVRVEWRHLKFQTGSSTFHILDNKTDLEKGRSRDKSVRCRQSSWVATAGSTVPIGCVTFLTGVLCSDLTLLKRLQGGFI